MAKGIKYLISSWENYNIIYKGQNFSGKNKSPRLIIMSKFSIKLFKF